MWYPRFPAGRVHQRPAPPTLRQQVVPKASAGSGVQVLIGGQTAIFADFAGVLSGKLPLFIGVVVLLSFLLLMAVFRSLVIPATAAIMNMLSAAAAFGVTPPCSSSAGAPRCSESTRPGRSRRSSR